MMQIVNIPHLDYAILILESRGIARLSINNICFGKHLLQNMCRLLCTLPCRYELTVNEIGKLIL